MGEEKCTPKQSSGYAYDHEKTLGLVTWIRSSNFCLQNIST